MKLKISSALDSQTTVRFNTHTLRKTRQNGVRGGVEDQQSHFVNLKSRNKGCVAFTMASFRGKGSRKKIRNLQGKIIEELWSYRNYDAGVCERKLNFFVCRC